MEKSPDERPFLAVFKLRLASANYMATPQIVYPSHQEDPHGLLGLIVVHIPGVLQGWEGGTRDGNPVHMQTIWGASHARLLRPVKVMKLTVS